jgi:hypothetical protein
VNLTFLPGVPENPLYSIIALLPFIAAALLYAEGRKPGAFLAAWIPITLLPPLLIVMTDVEYPVGERFLYLPAAGFCLLLAYVAGSIRNKRVLASCFIPVLALYMAGTYSRVQTWKSDTAIWENAALNSPKHVLPHIHHGISLTKAGRQAEGEEAFKAALANNGITQDELLLIAKFLNDPWTRRRGCLP